MHDARAPSLAHTGDRGELAAEQQPHLDTTMTAWPDLADNSIPSNMIDEQSHAYDTATA